MSRSWHVCACVLYFDRACPTDKHTNKNIGIVAGRRSTAPLGGMFVTKSRRKSKVAARGLMFEDRGVNTMHSSVPYNVRLGVRCTP